MIDRQESRKSCRYLRQRHQNKFLSNSFKALKIVRLRKTENMNRFIGSYFFGVPSMGNNLRVRAPTVPDSGELLANDKGVHREVESGRSLVVV